MSTKIIINENAYLVRDENNFQPFIFKAGGVEVKNPRTGEISISADKFVSTGTYHSTLEGAICELAKHKTLEKEEYQSLFEYVNEYKSAYSFLKECLNEQ